MERRTSFWSRHINREAGFNLSWGSVIAGAVTFVAVFLVLNLITSALGFGFINPTEAEPLSGVGVSTGISLVITFLIAFYMAGFVSGIASGRTGLLHGFLTWALSIILLFSVVVSLISNLVNTAVNVTTTVATGTAEVVGSGAGVAGDAVGAGADALYNQISESLGTVNTDELQGNVEEILADTDIPELQPDYLENELQTSRDEIVEAGKQIVLNPENRDAIIEDLTTSLSDRAETIGNAADRDAIANAVEANTDLTQAEAEEATDNIYNGLVTATEEAQVQLENASVQIQETQQEIETTVDQTVADAEQTAEDVADTFSTGSIIVFIGLLIGLCISSIGGVMGANLYQRPSREEREVVKR